MKFITLDALDNEDFSVVADKLVVKGYFIGEFPDKATLLLWQPVSKRSTALVLNSANITGGVNGVKALVGYDGNDWVVLALHKPIPLDYGRQLSIASLNLLGVIHTKGDSAYFVNTLNAVNGVANVGGHAVFNGTAWEVTRLDSGNVLLITSSLLSIPDDVDTILVRNGAIAVTIPFPPAINFPRRKITIVRSAPSTGAVNMTTVGNNITNITTGALVANATLGTIGSYAGRATFQSNGTAWYFVG